MECDYGLPLPVGFMISTALGSYHSHVVGCTQAGNYKSQLQKLR